MRLLLAFMVAVLLCAICLPAIALADESDVVRVGYYENEVFQEGASEGTPKTGYAYEYYRKLSEYTGWRYEYVYGTYGELYQKLLDGDIDLLAGLAYREERVGLIGYPDAPMGHETYNLVRHDSDVALTAEASTLQGCRIGVLQGAMVDALQGYLDERHVQAEVVTFDDPGELFAAFDSDSVDILAAEGDGAYGRSHAQVLCSFGSSDYYLCVSARRDDLLAELNLAQEMLQVEDPGYLSVLNSKYYSASVSSKAYSSDEQEWLDAHDTIKVGYMLHYLPYCDTDGQGQVTGIVKEMVPDMLESLNVTDVTVDYQAFESYDDMIAAVNDETIDVAFPVGGGLYFSEENGIYQSNAVASATTELVYKGEFTDETPSHFAVNENNRMQYYYVKTNFPDAQITLYPSIGDCLEAVLSGQVSCTTLNGLRANDILKNSRYRDLMLHQLRNGDDRCFGVKIGNEGLLKLVNRGISVLGADYAQGQAYRYTDGLYSYSTLDMVRDHLGIFVTIALVIAALTIALLTNDSRKTKAYLREQERARMELEEKNRELKNSRDAFAETNDILANAGYGVWHIVLEEGRLPRMRGNAKMRELLGVAGQDLSEEELYDAWYSRILEEEIPSVQASMAEMLEGRLSENTYRWDHPERGVIYVRCGGTSAAREDGVQLLRGYHGDVTDIVQSEMKQREALSDALVDAEQASRAKTTFLNNMSHDIRTPMNAIVGFTALAQSHIDNREQVRDYLEKISMSSQHLLSLINDVLDMSRIESGKVTIEEAEVHLPDLVHDIRTIIQANMSAKRQDFFVDTKGVTHEDIVTDRLRLNQVLLNILSNAVKFTPEGGAISFRVIEVSRGEDDRAEFEFRVKDNGIGMSEEFKKSIFDAFTRERTSTVSGIQGTGLGMAITKNIVDMMGGTIEVESEEGKGSEFIVRIPCAISDSPKTFELPPELHGVRALVVDDDENSCLSVCEMLHDMGMRPEWTNRGEDAVVHARRALERSDDFGTFFVDLLMPGLGGIETVRRIREVVGNSVPIIILTAYDWNDVESEAREAGATMFCSKPVFMSQLCRILAKSFRTEEGPQEVGKQEDGDTSLVGRRVLLAEDNELNQVIATTILEELDLVVEIACDGTEAVEMMREAPSGHFDVILMDIQMPRMDGYEATRCIRALDDEEKASIPIIAVTANALEEDRKAALDAGMDGHLAKPYDVPVMIETLRELFA